MKKNCMLMPGNPAISDYYLSWIKEIQEQDKNINVVYATSYVLYDRKLNYIEYDQALRKHYEKILLELSIDNKVTIIAHSVGSYFALRLLEKHPDKIEKVIIMFPYIGYSTVKSLRFVGIPYLMDRFFPLVELIVKYKNIFKRMDNEIINISSYGLTACLRFGVRQCVYFNKSKLNINTFSSQKDKINFIYKTNDRWCPSKTIELLKPISNHKMTDLPHDFIVRSTDRIKMNGCLEGILF